MATYQKYRGGKSEKEEKHSTEKLFDKLDKKAGKWEYYFEKYKKVVGAVFLSLLLISFMIWGYSGWIAAPGQQVATEQLAFAQKAFEEGNYQLAIEGDASNPGFVGTYEEYSGTDAGKTAAYMAGVSYYKLGDYQQAIKYMEDYKSKDKVLMAEAQGVIGDCFAQLGQNDQALKYYVKASGISKNEFIAPFYLMKAGNVAAYLGQYGDALKYFTQIKDTYPESAQAQNIDQYIEYAKNAR